MSEQFAIADVNLILMQCDRYRHHQRELRRFALIVIHDAYYVAIAIAHVHHLRRMIIKSGVGLADIKAAKGPRTRFSDRDCKCAYEHGDGDAARGSDTLLRHLITSLYRPFEFSRGPENVPDGN